MASEIAVPDSSALHPNYPGNRPPAWEVALLFPPQGSWRENDYLNLESICGDGIRAELCRGRLVVLPMPTEEHQDIVLFLLQLLNDFAKGRDLGKVSFSGLRVRLSNGDAPQFRQPDVAFMKKENAARRHNQFWEGADLVMEVVSDSPADRDRDYAEKSREYAAAGISEYWIIDPRDKVIQVLTLKDSTYEVHGKFKRGEKATSLMLSGFEIEVSEALDCSR